MHEAVTNSSVSTNNFLSATSDDLTTPVSRKHRQHTTDNFHWSQVHDFGTESTIEPHQNWHLLTPNNDISARLTPVRRNTPAGLPKISPTMPTRTENNPSDRTPGTGHRWRLNPNGQLVDSESAGWDLADEIVRLKIGEVAADSDDVHSHIRTPPKSRIPTSAVPQFGEASPLETSSNTSVGSSPHTPEHQINASHSRGSSTDTTASSSQESVDSATVNTSLAKPPLKVNTGTSTGTEVKERPHSFSGGLSSADLRRLQQAGDGSEAGDRQLHQQQWAQGQYTQHAGSNAEQLSYPSLATHIHRPQPQLHPHMYDYRSGASQLNEAPVPPREELQIDYNTQQRNFNPIPQGLNLGTATAGPAFVQGRPNNNIPAVAYRPRGFPQQGQVTNSAAIPYPGGHVSHLSLGNTQQLYDMMLPGHPEGHHAAVTRVQQQHNVFRATHHHSASDPTTAMRDAAALLLNNNMPAFAPGMFQPGLPLPMYPNQYFGAQEQYPLPDANVMAARLQAQYTGPYAVLPPQPVAMEGSSVSSPTTSTNGPGPSANNRKLGLYKTELCRSWEEKGSCRYGTKCQFAHGEEELRKVSRHPKYKTEICRTFWVSGSCPYGKRCCFIHTELPTSGATAATVSSGTPVTDSAPPQQRPDGRARSLSTNSDPNEANVSILARISAKRGQEQNHANSVDPNTFQFSRPPTGSLRVDTSTLDTTVKQNKSAYPSFASNGVLLPAPEPVRAKSPGPVTAGPDLGRHNNSRREIVGFNNQQRTHKPNDSSVHHPLNGSDADVNFSTSPPNSGHSSYVLSPPESGRVNGHHRAGSAGNWGSFSRSNNHFAASAFPHGSSPATDVVGNSPWVTNDLPAVGASRLHEKVWA